MSTFLDIVASAGLWAAVLRIATPLVFGTLGALLSERSGVLNLGIEGIMTFGAMIGWLAVFNGADLWTGMLVAALSGALFGLVHAAMTVTLGLSQHVTGLGITLFASSLSYYIFRLTVPLASTPPTVTPKAIGAGRDGGGGGGIGGSVGGGWVVVVGGGSVV